MPSGFYYKRLVSFVRNDASSNFEEIVQRDYRFVINRDAAGHAVVSDGAATTATLISVSAVIPSLVRKVVLDVTTQGTASGQQQTGVFINDPNRGFPLFVANHKYQTSTTTDPFLTNTATATVSENGHISYNNIDSDDRATIKVVGGEFPL